MVLLWPLPEFQKTGRVNDIDENALLPGPNTHPYHQNVLEN